MLPNHIKVSHYQSQEELWARAIFELVAIGIALAALLFWF
jgi:hypothetical protein